MNKKQVQDYIDQNAKIFTDVSDAIWEYAELSLKEFKSCALYVKELQKAGFEVESPFGGIETAFKASYGSGKPVIGILAEYDALSGLSQVAGKTTREELVPDGSGHGCGHNMLGAGAMAAAYGVKKYLEEKGPGSGTVIFYGCPGEEGGASKAFFARDGLWKELDIALAWHPGTVNQVNSGTCNSCIQTEYQFTGLAAHAASMPEFGRSALDAMELMNIGVQYLREHMPSGARIHYAITDGGGFSPNVVQPHAKVLYMVRSKLVKDALELQERVDQIAEGAAMMTGTTVNKQFIDGCSNKVPNKALEQLMWQNFSETKLPEYTAEEIAYAKELIKSYEMVDEALPGNIEQATPEILEWVKEVSKNGTVPFNNFLFPYSYSEQQNFGSTDVGDVSWLVPTAELNCACLASKSPDHSWQNVSCGCTSIGHKGLLTAGKVLAATAIDLLEDPALIEAAKKEHAEKTTGGYYCPVPKDAVPIAI